MEDQRYLQFGEKRRTLSIRQQTLYYLAYWPIFLTCVFLCVSGGALYIRNTVPKYQASTTFLVKGEMNGSSNSNDLIEEALNGKREVNLNNEMLLIGSARLMQHTVAKYGFNVSYFREGRLLSIDLHKDAPFFLVGKEITDSTRVYSLSITRIDIWGGSFSYGSESQKLSYGFKWGVPFKIDGQTFVLEAKKQIREKDGGYIVQWTPVPAAAAEITKDLSIRLYDTKTSVIQLSLKTVNLEKGKEILNSLFTEFNLDEIENRNRLSRNTVEFIDERLLAISSELKGVEGNLESYQGKNQLVDIKSQSSQSLENSNSILKTLKELSIQQSIADMILDYFNKPTNNKLVPTSLGLNDPTLTSLITQYNELQLKKERETPLVAVNSNVMQDLNTQLSNLKGSILESLTNINKNLRLQERSFQIQNSSYQSFLSRIPHNERILQEIKRKQGITEGLYLYLLQKREESAISAMAADVTHYVQIDKATGFGPVEPNTRNIILYSILLAFVATFAWISLKNILDDKIHTKDDITAKVSVPILAEIDHVIGVEPRALSVLDSVNTVEQFRRLRTNLAFLLKDQNKKVILVTSGQNQEGKSFISLNLSAVLATPGKKVALLEFDVRKPTIAKDLGISFDIGLTDYLAAGTRSLSGISHPIRQVAGLDFYPCGSNLSSTTDLLLSKNLSHLFCTLRKEYDYVIIDSSSINSASDSFILAEHADMTIFTVRFGITKKENLDLVQQIIREKKLNTVTLVLNDLKRNKNSHYLRLLKRKISVIWG